MPPLGVRELTAMAKNTGVIQLQGNLNFAKGGQVCQKPASRTVTAVGTLENDSESSLLGEAFRSCIANASVSSLNPLNIFTHIPPIICTK